MTDDQIQYVVSELAEAYRILRNAYHANMDLPEPPLTPLQERVQEVIAALGRRR